MRISDWSSDVCSSDLLAIMLTALQAVERSPAAAAIGYEVVINSDDEVSSLGSAPLLAAAARGKAAAFTYEPALPDGPLAGARDRKSVVTGKSVSVRVDLVGRRRSKKKTIKHKTETRIKT